MKRRGLRRRVAVLFDAIEDDYQEEILRGILAEAEHAQVDLVLLAGGVVGDEGRPSKLARNFLFDTIDTATFDGFISLSGSLGNALGPERFGDWAKRYAGKPIVHVGIEVKGADSIVVDNGRAMYQMVRHLIVEHGKRHLAFVRGPSQSSEAEQRYAAYRSALTDHGIDFDENWVIQGDWLRESGEAAVNELLDRRGIVLRGAALVAANDYMALGALDALRAHGLIVPHDVALSGFDDLNVTRTAVPPLSTIRQPTTRLGQEALRRLVSAIGGRAPEPTLNLPAEVMLRASCGCRAALSPLAPHQRGPTSSSLRAELMARKQLILAEMSRAARGTLHAVGSGWEDRVLSALLADLTQHGSLALTATLERMIGKLPVLGFDLGAFHAILDVLRHAVRAAQGSDAEAAAQASDVLDDARKLIGDAVSRMQLFKGAQTLHKLHEMTQVAALLLGDTPLGEQRPGIERRLRELGIAALSLGMFAERDVAHEKCAILAAYNGSKVASQTGFERSSFGPEGLFDDGVSALLVQPLVVDSEPVGLIALDWGAWEGVAYEQIREVLSVGLKAVQLRQRGGFAPSPIHPGR